MARPIVTWAGGKRLLIDKILDEAFPTDGFKAFHEPMVGGGALFFHLEPDQGSINDINDRLINLYKVVRDRPNDLIESLNHDSLEYSETFYYRARDTFNALRSKGRLISKDEFEVMRTDSSVEYNILDDSELPTVDPLLLESTLLLYLNKTCFNGLYRENNSGEFNVPFGRHDSPVWAIDGLIEQAHEVLATKGLEIRSGNFDYVLDLAITGDLVYFDPPYPAKSETAYFSKYNSADFSHKEETKLRDTILQLADNGTHVILSNIPKFYNGTLDSDPRFIALPVGVPRTINSNSENRGKVEELIITNCI